MPRTFLIPFSRNARSQAPGPQPTSTTLVVWRRSTTSGTNARADGRDTSAAYKRKALSYAEVRLALPCAWLAGSCRVALLHLDGLSQQDSMVAGSELVDLI